MRVLLFSLFVVLSACASVPAGAPTYARAPDPPAGLSNVYIYRIGAYPTLRAPMVRLDGRAVISPAEGSYTVVQLPPGSHQVMVDWAWDTGWPDVSSAIEVEEGAALYLKISGDFEIVSRTYNGFNYEATSIMMPIEQEVAEREMAACCRYVRPRRE